MKEEPRSELQNIRTHEQIRNPQEPSELPPHNIYPYDNEQCLDLLNVRLELF